MDNELFNKWLLEYSNSEDINLNVIFFREDHSDPNQPKIESELISEITTDEMKECIGESLPHVAFADNHFDVVVHAVKDNLVYISVFEKMDDDFYSPQDRFMLNKKIPNHSSKIMVNGKQIGTLMVSVKEWGGVKRGIIL